MSMGSSWCDNGDNSHQHRYAFHRVKDFVLISRPADCRNSLTHSDMSCFADHRLLIRDAFRSLHDILSNRYYYVLL